MAEIAGQIASVSLIMGAMLFGLGRVVAALSGRTGEVAAQSILRQTGINGGIGAIAGIQQHVLSASTATVQTQSNMTMEKILHTLGKHPMTNTEFGVRSKNESSLAREGELFASLKDNLWDSVKDHLQHHKDEIIVEAAGAMVLGVGLAALTKNPALLGEALAPAVKAGVPFVGKVGIGLATADWAVKIGVPAYDVWNNPSNLASDKQMLASNVGSGLVDYTAMGIGGIAGGGIAWKLTPKGRILVHSTRDNGGKLEAFSFVSLHDESPTKFAGLDFFATDEARQSTGVRSLHLQWLTQSLKTDRPDVYPWEHPFFAFDLSNGTSVPVSALERIGSLPKLTPSLTDKIRIGLGFWNKEIGSSSAELAAVRDEVSEHAKAPLPFLTDALKNNRILAFGESHFAGRHRAIGATLMPSLRTSGATHLALEIPEGSQSILDKFVESGTSTALKGIPEGLIDTDYFLMLRNARDSGLKLVAADSYKSMSGIWHGNRDVSMADNISAILDSDPNTKVVFWTGAGHLERSGNTAAEYLARRFPIFTVHNMDTVLGMNPLSTITQDISSTAAVRTSIMPIVSQLGAGTGKDTYGLWDAVLLHAPAR